MDATKHDPARPRDEFAEVVRGHQAGVMAAAYGVTGDRALSEDIAQDTFIAAWRGRSALRDPAKLRAWLCAIARNLARKSRRRRAVIEPLAELAADDDLARAATASDEARLTWAALRELPAAYREALALYYWEDQPVKQLAEALGITEATAMQRLSRGRAMLRAEVQRIVEGTLRRARPGAEVTTAILVAVAATAAGARAAEAGTRAMRDPGGLISRRTIWKAGVTVVAAGAVGVLESRGVVGALVANPRTDVPGAPGDARASVHGAGWRGGPSTPASSSSPPGHTASPAGPHDDPGGVASAAPAGPGDDDGPDGDSMLASVVIEGSPAGWPIGKLEAALSLCGVEELNDNPCRIELAVRDGAIAATAVEPFEGGTHRVVVRPLHDDRTALGPSELVAWLAADQLIHAHRDDPQLADRDQAIEVAALVGLCAKARVERLAVAVPDGTYHLRFGWVRPIARPVDWQAYLDLEVATGACHGPAAAPVTVVVFADIADSWGFGWQSLAAWREAMARYPDDVRLVVKQCPFPTAGHELAAEAIHAAHAQGALWPMLERVAATRERLAIDDLVRAAAGLPLDVGRLRSDLERGAFREAVEIDQDHRVAMDVDALPIALVNGKRVHGALPADTYVQVIQSALRRLSRPV
jgi:RNA polymerase sigma factor (sigma-70 family)